VAAGRRGDDVTDQVRPDEELFAEAPPEVIKALGGRVPTLQQWRAISHPLDPCVVMAGAGSGKTAVITARLVYLVLVRQGVIRAEHPGALPSEILCLTFTNKAAEELSHRVRSAVEGLGLPEGEEPTVLTYHAFAAGLVEDYGLRMGIEPGRTLLSEAHKWQLAASLLADREFEHLEVRTIGHVVGNMLKLADQCANHLVSPENVARHSAEMAERGEVRRASDRDMLETALKRVELAGLVAAYGDRKGELGVLDYGDQISQADGLVRDFPEVAEQFRARFPIVLLDEYQDTNVAQARLLQELCGRDHAVFAVGDPDQNIYAWRGASLHNILTFAEDFRSDPAPSLPLYVNFRSGSRILAVADAVIAHVPPERRAPEKELRPEPSRGEGLVQAFVAADAYAEARQIAAMIKKEAAQRNAAPGGDLPWQDFAVLCRKKRLFGPIVEILREEAIPVEVVDLGGLLQVPEVVDVVSWLRLLDDPARNVALARILQGRRWRIGYRDLAALARWSSRHTKNLATDLGIQDRAPGDVAFALSESLEHLDDEDMVGLSDEARDRLREFRTVFAALREAARGPLADLVAEIMDRSGVLGELEASSELTAVGARRNLLNLVQHISSFSPVEGEATLSTLVTYLDASDEAEDTELEPVQLSEANTVKLLTIHKAKGLEWPVVFVPGLAEHSRWSNSSIFPDVSRQPNPVTQPATLPFELRGDRDLLPTYEGNINRFKAALKERGLEEERRLCYVALTRARDVLVASCAHWYGDLVDSHQPGVFYEEIAQHEATEVLFEDDPADENPLIEIRRERAATWPLPGRRDDADELFPEGWHEAAVGAVRDPSLLEQRIRELPATEVGEFRRLASAHAERAALIEERVEAEPAPSVPTTLSVSSVLAYLRCPKLFFWSQVRPLPRRPSEAARLGTEVHRWIELQGRGQGTLIDVDELPDLSTEERLGEPGTAPGLKDAFRASRFAEQVPLFTERPFLLYLDGIVVGGRIDAIFGTPEGPWEVVDYKTGRVPPDDDALAGMQLDLYALACGEVWGKRPEDLTLTYFYLREGKEVSRPAGDVEATRKRLMASLSEMAQGIFDPSPGDQCRWCDFLTFCDAGRAHVAELA
jgi:DNA helicase II / ATP-dependent DNA helicase PcrA